MRATVRVAMVRLGPSKTPQNAPCGWMCTPLTRRLFSSKDFATSATLANECSHSSII